MNNTPKLRFKEFSGDWESKKLSYYTEKITRKNKGFIVTNVISNSAKNGLISQKEFFDRDIANQSNIDGYYIIEKGNFVYNPRKSLESPYGPVNRYNLEDAGVVSPLYLCFKINEKIYGEFLEYYFKSSKWYRFIYENSDQGVRHDRVSIKDSDFFKLDTRMPLKEEQEKIAFFFSLIDKKIILQQEKLEAYKDYKRGTLQSIFNREIRLKNADGEYYPEWKVKKLNEVLIEQKSKNTGDLKVCSVAVRKGVVDQIEHLGRSFAAKDTSNYNLVKYGDVIYTKSPTGDFPYGIIKQSFLDDDVVVSPLYGVFKPLNFNLGYILHSYFYYKENTNNYLYSIVQKGAKNTINITNTTFLSKSLMLPMDEDEQCKIANLLMKLDNKIDKEQEKLDSLNEYKKGLLQQMFV